MRKSAILLAVLVLAIGLGASCSRGRSDQDISADVRAKMFSDPQLKVANLDVAAKNGEVTLTGEVPNDAARYQAFKLATETQGVTKVNDRMSVKIAEAPPVPETKREPAPAPAPARKLTRKASAARKRRTLLTPRLLPPSTQDSVLSATTSSPTIILSLPCGSG